MAKRTRKSGFFTLLFEVDRTLPLAEQSRIAEGMPAYFRGHAAIVVQGARKLGRRTFPCPDIVFKDDLRRVSVMHLVVRGDLNSEQLRQYVVQPTAAFLRRTYSQARLVQVQTLKESLAEQGKN